MQDTSPRTGADCLQEERASVFQLKELFFPPPLFFLPFLLDCECVTLRSDPRGIPEWQLSPFTVLLAAQPADRSWLSWDQEGLMQVSGAAFYYNPLPFQRHSLVTSKIDPPPPRKKSKSNTHKKTKNTCITAHSNKRVWRGGGGGIRKKPMGGGKLLLSI